MMASEVLISAGFTGEALAIALGVSYAEADGPAATARFGVRSAYADAVGDIFLARLGPYSNQAYAVADIEVRKAAGKPVPSAKESVIRQEADGKWYVVNTKWGPSVGWFQIRALDDPNAWGVQDRLRIADKLRDPVFSAGAAWIISKHGTDWSLWSTFVHGTYLPYKGLDFELRLGHPDALKWSA